MLTLTRWWGRWLILFFFVETLTRCEDDFIFYLYLYMKLFLMGKGLDDSTSYPKANCTVSESIQSEMIYLLRVLCSLVTVFLSCQLGFLSQHFFPQSLASSRKEAIEHSLEDPRSTDCSSVLGTYSRALSSAWSDCVNPYPVWASLITLPLRAFQWVPAGFFRCLWTIPCFLVHCAPPGTDTVHAVATGALSTLWGVWA